MTPKEFIDENYDGFNEQFTDIELLYIKYCIEDYAIQQNNKLEGLLKQANKMTRNVFIRKWLGNPDKQYTDHDRMEMLDDLDSIGNKLMEWLDDECPKEPTMYMGNSELSHDFCIILRNKLTSQTWK